jgi:glycosyltransferase involved in cell wall biosynthesis
MHKVTVITVVYNGVKTLEGTICSVISQTHKYYEYIIIDGASSDGTLDIINKYKNNIDLCISEPDNGIYDAMNKGISYATGEWVIFMNSGDNFFSNSILNNVFCESYEDIGVIYGSVNCFDKFKSVIITPKLISNLENDMAFCHQSSFVRKDLLMKNNFDTKYKIAADFNLFYSLYKEGIKFAKFDNCIATYEVENGLSSRNGYLSAKEKLLIIGKWGQISPMIYFYFQITIFYFNYYLKKIGKVSFLKKYFKIKYANNF